MKAPLILAALAAALGCGTTTQIVTEPPGATATLNDTKFLGTTPITVEAQIFAWSQHTVRLDKEGYEPVNLQLQPVQPLNTKYLALCLCTFTTLWPLGLLSDFERPLYEIALVPIQAEDLSVQITESPRLIFSAR